MQITVACTRCSNRYDVDEKFAGRTVKCKQCGNIFTIASPHAQHADPPDPFVNLSRAPLPETEIAPPPVQRPIGPAFGYSAPAIAVQRQRKRSGIGRAGGDTGSVGVDGVTPYVLFLYIAASAVAGIYATVKLYSNLDQHVAGSLVGHVWSWVVVWNILFFAIVGPLVWMGVWFTSKIFDFEMVDSAYLRACGVAGLPVVLFYVAQMLPSNPVLIGLMLLAILPLTFYMLMHAFDLDWAGSAVAFVLGGALWVGGFMISFLILGAVVAGGLMGAAFDRQLSLTADAGSPSPSAPSPAPPPTYRPPPAAPRDFDADAIARLRETLARRAVQDMSRSTREEMADSLAGVKSSIELLRAKHENEPAWQELARALAELEQKITALPSGDFGDAYFSEAPAGDDWSTGPQSSGGLAGEVSFKNFYIRPPLDMKLDLRSAESGPEGLVWMAQKSSIVRLSLATLPRKNPKQLRPVTPDRPGLKRAAEAQNLFAVDAEGATVTTGTINSLRFTKIALDPGDPKYFQRAIVYVAASGDQWLVITVSARREEAQLAQAMDVSARSLRKGEPGEEKVDPFSAKFIAARLADDPEHAGPILRAQGEDAEAALSPLLESEDFFLRKRAAQILEKLATKKSLPALETAANSKDTEVAASARAAIKRLDPENHDEVTDLLDQLDSGTWVTHKEALQKLAGLTPQDNRRAAVVAKLLAICKDKNQDRFLNSESIGKAIANWGDPKVVPDLLPLLDRSGDRNARRIAMTALGALKDKRGASAVVMWLYEEPQQTIAALTAMGPAAEDAVIPHLRNADARVRTSAAQVLEQVGTRKCLSELDRAAHDMRGRDASARETAQLAITAVKARIAAGKPDAGASDPPAK